MKLLNREISWLSFNARVLQEASDATVPLLERLRFLGIFSSNLDEFFRVRVATLKRMAHFNKKAKKTIGESPKKVIDEIFKIVITQQSRFNVIYQSLLKELEKENIFIINERQLTSAEGAFVRNYFQNEVRANLVPLMVDGVKDFPYLRDHSIYLAVLLTDSKEEYKQRYSLIEVPTETNSRFLVLPRENEVNRIILLDDVIRYCLDDIFYVFPHDTYRCSTIKITRDAELDLLEDVSESFMDKIEKGLKQRKKGKPVRLIYDASIDAAMLDYFLDRMHLKKGDDNLVAGARYHNFKDFMNFPSLGKTHLLYPKAQQLPHPDLPGNKSILSVIAQRDVLLHYPYHSFNHFIDYLREAAIDPKVQEIQITLYRLAKNSKVANALINAVRNGKKVFVLMELQARFDEEHNIYWSDRMREEGAHVVFGIPGLKVHTKVCLITRKEKGEQRLYANVSTGNYNESTAKLYCDHSLFTSNAEITGELQQMFDFFVNSYKVPEYKHLLMSPTTMRRKLLKLIDKEIEQAAKGLPARMDIKINNLADQEMIEKVIEAASAGVKFRMIARSTFCFANVPSEAAANIQAISIVDKFLEHSRILVFYNGGDELVYITSADWMARNLNARVEMACPIYDPGIKKELKDYFDIQFSDTVKARILDEMQQNNYRPATIPPVRSQEAIFEYLRNTNRPTKSLAEIIPISSGMQAASS